MTAKHKLAKKVEPDQGPSGESAVGVGERRGLPQNKSKTASKKTA